MKTVSKYRFVERFTIIDEKERTFYLVLIVSVVIRISCWFGIVYFFINYCSCSLELLGVPSAFAREKTANTSRFQMYTFNRKPEYPANTSPLSAMKPVLCQRHETVNGQGTLIRIQRIESVINFRPFAD